MNYNIRIERIPYEEPAHLQLLWKVSNGNTSTTFEYYDDANSLTVLADNLEQFPQNLDHEFIYEIGSEKPEDRFAYYFSFHVFVADSRGTSGIHIKFSNNQNLPYREIVDFCILTEPAMLNRLGKLFREFSKLEDNFLGWSESENYVGDTAENA